MENFKNHSKTDKANILANIARLIQQFAACVYSFALLVYISANNNLWLLFAFLIAANFISFFLGLRAGKIRKENEVKS